jgi:hypothetical protein
MANRGFKLRMGDRANMETVCVARVPNGDRQGAAVMLLKLFPLSLLGQLLRTDWAGAYFSRHFGPAPRM